MRKIKTEKSNLGHENTREKTTQHMLKNKPLSSWRTWRKSVPPCPEK
jgi:hypothetical protein